MDKRNKDNLNKIIKEIDKRNMDMLISEVDMRREIKKLNERLKIYLNNLNNLTLRKYKISSDENLTENLKIIRKIKGIVSKTIEEIGQAVIDQSEISSEKFNFLCETLFILIPNDLKFDFVQKGLVLVDKIRKKKEKT